MGEFADIANERWADGDWEEDQEDEFPVGKTCRFCKAGFLSWHWTDRGWRLHSYDHNTSKYSIHVCKDYTRK